MTVSFITHVTGARPNFPKAGPVIKALSELGIQQRLIHTGQHYDDKMSEIFFRELELPRPDQNLGVGSGKHGEQTARAMILLEEEFLANPPALVIVYGDINSTVAASLVAAKLQIPVAHVEAGLRSFDRSMPEEVNRLVTDQLSDLLFATSPDAIAHLANEGVDAEKIHFVGNPMIDTLLANLEKATLDSRSFDFSIPEKFAIVTLHRPSNVDDDELSKVIVNALNEIADLIPLIVPLHPRGRAQLEALGFGQSKNVQLVDPLGYLDFVTLMRTATAVITDSGGVQEETTILNVPCLTLRKNTERPITISHGTNRLVEPSDLVAEVSRVLEGKAVDPVYPPLWDGQAGKRIAKVIAEYLQSPAKN
jgi:UDP-N-acetylglucosamine 2-epimerase (non-hydrolysing)